MSEWKHHRLRRAELAPDVVIGIPDDWTFGREESGRFWCGREDGDVTLFVQAQVLDGRRAPFRRCVDEMVAFLHDVPGRRSGVEIRPKTPSEACVHAVVDHEEDGAPYRTFRWYFYRAIDPRTVAHLRFILSMPVGVCEEPANRELVAIFGEQIRGAETTDIDRERLTERARAWAALPETERAGCRLGWHRLRFASPFGFIHMLVPENWPVDEWDAKAGMWCLCDDPADNVTLWVDYKTLKPRPWRSGVDLERELENAVAAAMSRNGRVRGRRVHAEGGSIVATVHEGVEDGMRLRYWRWELAQPRFDGGGVIVHFSLVTTPAVHDTPDEALLVRIFDEELPHCGIGEAPA